MSERDRIEVDVNGQTFSGWYSVHGGLVRAASLWGAKSTQAGASAKATAEMLLREIVRGALASGEIES